MPILVSFFEELQQSHFKGEYSLQEDQRSVYSTDNSVYQRKPQAVIWPKSTTDIQIVVTLLNQSEYQNLHLTARGGGTGTNGQSLTDGIVLDLSRYMNQIINIDSINKTATVQAGVVKDQLNEALKAHGLFFAPELSTSNRATIGGMINTDASGQGSCRYGKTHHHIIRLRSVALNGEILDSQSIARSEFSQTIQDKSPWQKKIYTALYQLADNNRQIIDESFPKLNRSLTGYDLPNLLTNEHFNLNHILCGSEGSLAIVSEATVNLESIPQYRILINIGYANFQDALSDAKSLMQMNPLSIETVDSKVLNLAQTDIVWEKVKEFFPENDQAIAGINLVEVNAEDAKSLDELSQAFITHLQSDQQVVRLSITHTADLVAINHLYAMRKKSVGLLGNVSGDARPIPFVEDCAVPPEHLDVFITEFRKLLDSYHLNYGMFGHVDAGVLHVRPQLDLRDENTAEIIQSITEKLVGLVHHYGGVLWGEHGKGLRSGYAPKFFSKTWPLMQEVKALFDPNNQLNPGKIATPDPVKYPLTGLLEVPLRGDKDRRISPEKWQDYGSTMYCNGNAVCYNYDFNDVMCPSWKQSRDRIHSPKGRATLIKEWLYRQSTNTLDAHFEKQVYDALHGCLSCKSCAGQCPVKVDIPDAKARFLENYHQRYRRSIRDYLICSIETTLPYLHKISGAYNFIQGLTPIKKLQRSLFSVDNLPSFDAKSKALFKETNAFLIKDINTIQIDTNKPAIFLLQDAFTRYFDTQVLMDWIRLLEKLDLQVYVLPYFPSGKPKHVYGFLKQFHKIRQQNEKILAVAQQYNVPIVGLDPAMTLIFRQEYLKDIEKIPARKIQLPQEWLHSYIKDKKPFPMQKNAQYYLASHCTEKTNLANSEQMWGDIFKHFGLDLRILKTGCCGMAGTYGHETEHSIASKEIYQLSWQEKIEEHQQSVLATGYSCRCQVKNQSSLTINHPVQTLLHSL